MGSLYVRVEQNGILPYDDIILSMKEGDLLNQRYQLLERLGSGGMAEVYRARDLMLERSVAIKVLRADYSSDKEFQERFRQEARQTSSPSTISGWITASCLS
jgi:serine/threonine protein kinase